MGRGNFLSHPGGWGMLAPRVAVTHPRFVVLFLCLVSFLPWGPPPHKAELVLSAEGAPRGPPVGRGVGPRSRTHTSPPPQEPPQSPAQLVPRHFQNPGIRTSCPFLPSPPVHWDRRRLESLAVSGKQARGHFPGCRELGLVKRPPAHSSFLCQSMEKLAAGHGIPSLPCSGGRSRARWEL